jgi:Fuc2NAc and GlcNAc transferase
VCLFVLAPLLLILRGEISTVLLLLGSIAISWLITYIAILVCRRFGVLDVPNGRSAHSTVTPRGGGVGIYLPVLAMLLFLLQNGRIEQGLGRALFWGGLLVAALGAADDVKSLPVAVRLPTHLLAALSATLLILPMGSSLATPFVISIATIFIAGMLNTYNFMDGIDGLAGSESAFGGLAMMVVAGASGIAGLGDLGTVVLGASFGFLAWNWPRAKIFMGDAASGFLGFLFGCVTIAGAARDPRVLWPWVIVFGVFLVDSGLTLLVRLLRREAVFQAHSKHAYQNLARLYRSHWKVTAAVNALNLFWLGPFAWVALQTPRFAPWIALFALVPLGVVALRAGAGRTRFA